MTKYPNPNEARRPKDRNLCLIAGDRHPFSSGFVLGHSLVIGYFVIRALPNQRSAIRGVRILPAATARLTRPASQFGPPEHHNHAMLFAWPLPCPRKWLQYIKELETEAGVKAIHCEINKDQP